MFAAVTPILTLLAAAAIYVRADPNPNNPGPGDVFVQGKPCTIGWDVDSTGVWKTMNIDLMTGDNFDMVFLTAVATVDGTNPSKNTFSFTCPEVIPHSPIYFYQFTSPSTTNKTWTGRFTITGSANDVVAPAQSTQPDGANIPWGTGSLVKGSSAASASAATTSTGGTTASASSTSSITSGSPLLSPSGDATPSVVYLTSDVASATASTVSTGAAATLSVSNILFQAGLALALAAFGFTMIL
ncbi:hypothetical protein HD554DRAFT_2205676 [Boletus coccyginus]|nr:hypothetical protein HD554DRAFT_2205676 [Boletus coccyginus]